MKTQISRVVAWVFLIYFIANMIPTQLCDEQIRIESGGKGESHYIIMPDGKLIGWGQNDQEQIPYCYGPYCSFIARKIILSNVIAVDMGYKCAMAVDKNGQLWAWGRQDNLKLNNAAHSVVNKPKKIMDGVTDVGMGDFHVVVIKKDGTLWAWGRFGNVEVQEPIKISERTEKVYVEGLNTFWITTNGELFFWNTNLSNMPIFVAADVSEVCYLGFADYFQYLTGDGNLFVVQAEKIENSRVQEKGVLREKFVKQICNGGVVLRDERFLNWKKTYTDCELEHRADNVYCAGNKDVYITTSGQMMGASVLSILDDIGWNFRMIDPIFRNVAFFLGGLQILFLVEQNHRKKRRI